MLFDLIHHRISLEVNRAGRAATTKRIESHGGVADLSIAQRQLVEIAKSLSHDARVIILDEPTSSLSDAEVDRQTHPL